MRDLVDRIPGACLGLRRAVGHDVDAPEPLAEYVLGLARNIITPEGRADAGFQRPVDVPADVQGAGSRRIATRCAHSMACSAPSCYTRSR